MLALTNSQLSILTSCRRMFRFTIFLTALLPTRRLKPAPTDIGAGAGVHGAPPSSVGGRVASSMSAPTIRRKFSRLHASVGRRAPSSCRRISSTRVRSTASTSFSPARSSTFWRKLSQHSTPCSLPTRASWCYTVSASTRGDRESRSALGIRTTHVQLLSHAAVAKTAAERHGRLSLTTSMWRDVRSFVLEKS